MVSVFLQTAMGLVGNVLSQAVAMAYVRTGNAVAKVVPKIVENRHQKEKLVLITKFVRLMMGAE